MWFRITQCHFEGTSSYVPLIKSIGTNWNLTAKPCLYFDVCIHALRKAGNWRLMDIWCGRTFYEILNDNLSPWWGQQYCNTKFKKSKSYKYDIKFKAWVPICTMICGLFHFNYQEHKNHEFSIRICLLCWNSLIDAKSHVMKFFQKFYKMQLLLYSFYKKMECIYMKMPKQWNAKSHVL